MLIRIERKLTPRLKEIPQHLGTLARKDTAADLRMMIKLLLGKKIDYTAASTGLGIRRAEHHPGDACVEHCARTHGARFKSDIETGASEPVISNVPCRRTHGSDLGVSSRIMAGNRRVITLPDHLSILHHDRADWHFAPSARVTRKP